MSTTTVLAPAAGRGGGHVGVLRQIRKVGEVAVDAAVAVMVVAASCGLKFLMKPPLSGPPCPKLVQAVVEPRLCLYQSRPQPRPQCLKTHDAASKRCFGGHSLALVFLKRACAFHAFSGGVYFLFTILLSLCHSN